MSDTDDTLMCSHCGAPMLASHSGPCFVCGKQSDNVPAEPEAGAESELETEPRAGQAVASERPLDTAVSASKFKIYLVLLLVLVLMGLSFGGGYYWRELQLAPPSAEMGQDKGSPSKRKK